MHPQVLHPFLPEQKEKKQKTHLLSEIENKHGVLSTCAHAETRSPSVHNRLLLSPTWGAGLALCGYEARGHLIIQFEVYHIAVLPGLGGKMGRDCVLARGT